MLDWLKFFSGSFFVNKLAMQGADRRVGNAILSFFLGWIFIFIGLTVGYSASFQTHYYNCTPAMQVVEKVFDGGISLRTQDYKAISGLDGVFDNGKVINTFDSVDDKEKYAVDGFNIILDTRPADTPYTVDGEEKTLRDWYVKNVFDKSGVGQYIAILDDMVIGEFTTDGGITVGFNGYYFKTDGIIYKTAEQGNDFIIKAFKGSSALNINIYFINLLKITPLFVIILVLLALVLWIIDKAAKFGVFDKFGKTLKVVCSFVLVSSIITFLLTIILSFFIPRGTVYSLAILIFGLSVFVRTTVLAIMRFVAEKRYRIPEIYNGDMP
ncbi:MAG: hypothetical protein NC311_11795 [Muribaculaceae bacterium]|nr:hypothetical protein [Muribaculaceae bacterium]